MARRKTRTVYRKAKRTYSRARSGLLSMGTFSPVIAGALGGAAGNLAGNYLGGYGKPIAHIGVGYFMKDKALMTIAGMELGSMFFGGNGVSQGGFFES